MPRSDRPSQSVRASVRNADLPNLPGPSPGSESPPVSESDSGSGGPGRHAGRQLNLTACPGCGKSFSSIDGLRRHRNSRWLRNSPCCRAGRMGKRPRILARAASGDSDSGSDAPDSEPSEAREWLNHMLRVGPNADLPAGAARADPILPRQPSDRVSDT